MKKLYSILLLILWPAVAWGDARSFEIPGTNPVLVQGVQGHPLMVPLEVNIAASAAVTVVQGVSGVDADPWNMMLRDSSGVELGLAASPFGVNIYDAASNLLGVTANPFVVDLGVNNDVTVTSGAITANLGSIADVATQTTLALLNDKFVTGTDIGDTTNNNAAGAAAVFTQGQAADAAAVAGNPFRMAGKDGGGLTQDIATSALGTLVVAEAVTSADGIADSLGARFQSASSADMQLEVRPFMDNGTTWDAFKGDATNGLFVNVKTSVLPAGASTSSNQTTGNTNTNAIELNTDTATTFADGTVSVTTTATLISAASATRRSILVRNADSNTVLFLGPTSGVTTANGLPVGTAGASGATGNGGTVIYSHTAAVWGIVASGTADTRFQTESD